MKGIGIYGSNFAIIKENTELIKESVKRILTTSPGENVGNLNFGCRLREYLFNFDNILLEDIEQVIESAITQWEPRVTINNINVELDRTTQEKIYITLDFKLKDTYEDLNLTIPIIF